MRDAWKCRSLCFSSCLDPLVLACSPHHCGVCDSYLNLFNQNPIEKCYPSASCIYLFNYVCQQRVTDILFCGRNPVLPLFCRPHCSSRGRRAPLQLGLCVLWTWAPCLQSASLLSGKRCPWLSCVFFAPVLDQPCLQEALVPLIGEQYQKLGLGVLSATWYHDF